MHKLLSIIYQQAGFHLVAIIERAVPALLVDEFVQLDLRRADFGLMQRTAEAIGRRFGLGTAIPIDARALNVRVPTDPLRRTAFMAALQDLDVPPVSGPAKVILNSRTGSVVMNQAVQLITISRCARKLDSQN